MNRKKWLAALAVIAVLAIAFFWGGNYPKQDAQQQSAAVQDEDGAAVVVTEKPTAEDPEGASDGGSATPTNSSASGQEAEGEDAEAAEGEVVELTPTPSASAGTEQAPSNKPIEFDPEKQNGSKPEQTPTVDVGKPSATKSPVKTTSPQATAKPDKAMDDYQTEPVPEGKPKPVEWQDTEVDKKVELTATLSVSAATVLNNLDMFDEDKLEVLPEDGMIFKARKVTFYEGESVFDVLLREMKKAKIHMEFEMTPIYNSNYIEGINNIYEFDGGELSGWMYKVNNWFPNYGSSRYVLEDGDVIEWVYTLDLGRDVGGDNGAAGAKP